MPSLSLDYSPIAQTLIVKALQKTDCFSGKTPGLPLGKAFEDFSKCS
jgi:hypothetical protein